MRLVPMSYHEPCALLHQALWGGTPKTPGPPSYTVLWTLQTNSDVRAFTSFVTPVWNAAPLCPLLDDGCFQDLRQCQLFSISLSYLDLHVAGSSYRTDASFLGISMSPKPKFSTWDILTLIVYPLLLMFLIVRNMLHPPLHLFCLA